MNCKQICEKWIFLYADNEMERELQVAYKRHMADCPQCARKARQTRRLLMIVREGVVRCEAPKRLRQRILATLPHRRGPQA